MAKISVIGSGGWGIALTILLHKNGHELTVWSFDKKEAEELIACLKPSIHVKGGDYKKEDLPETKIVESYGGEVIILNFVEGKSTTNIIEKINKK